MTPESTCARTIDETAWRDTRVSVSSAAGVLTIRANRREWYFPRGHGHLLECRGDEPCPFVLIFDNGYFSEFGTFSLTDWIGHTPRRCWRRTSAFPNRPSTDSRRKRRTSLAERCRPRSRPPRSGGAVAAADAQVSTPRQSAAHQQQGRPAVAGRFHPVSDFQDCDGRDPGASGSTSWRGRSAWRCSGPGTRSRTSAPGRAACSSGSTPGSTRRSTCRNGWPGTRPPCWPPTSPGRPPCLRSFRTRTSSSQTRIDTEKPALGLDPGLRRGLHHGWGAVRAAGGHPLGPVGRGHAGQQPRTNSRSFPGPSRSACLAVG